MVDSTDNWLREGRFSIGKAADAGGMTTTVFRTYFKSQAVSSGFNEQRKWNRFSVLEIFEAGIFRVATTSGLHRDHAWALIKSVDISVREHEVENGLLQPKQWLDFLEGKIAVGTRTEHSNSTWIQESNRPINPLLPPQTTIGDLRKLAMANDYPDQVPDHASVYVLIDLHQLALQILLRLQML